MAAAPIEADRGQTLGVLYGGVLLNGNFAIVDACGNCFSGQDVDGGAVSIFQNDLRISTTVRTAVAAGHSARRSARRQRAVLKRGETWRGRALVVKDWLITEYDPFATTPGTSSACSPSEF